MLATSILTVSYFSGNSRARLVHQSQDERTIHHHARDFGLSASGQAHAEAIAFASDRRLHVIGCLHVPVYGSGDLKGKRSTWTFTLSAERIVSESVTF